MGGPEARSNPGCPPHRDVSRAGRFRGGVPRQVGDAEHAALDGSPPPSPCHAVDSRPARPACSVSGPAPVATHLGQGGPDDAHGTQGPEGGVAGCGASAGDGPGGTAAAACRLQQGLWRVRPRVHCRYPSPCARTGQHPVRTGQAVGGGSGPQQGHGAHRASAIPGGAARSGTGCPAGAPHTLGRGGRPAQRGVCLGRACNMPCCVWRQQRTGGCPC